MSEENNIPESSIPEFKPQTDLDNIMLAGRNDPNEQDVPLKIIRALLEEKRVFFLSAVSMSKIEAGEKVVPLTLSGKGNEPVIAVFTHVSHIPQEYLSIMPHPIGVPGGAIIASIKGGGIILNAGTEVAFEISAKGVEAIKKDFLSSPEETTEGESAN